MTLKEFNKILKENHELNEKLKKAKANLNSDGNFADALSKIALDQGYDVPASEFSLGEISSKELDDSELEAVAGGNSFIDYQKDGCKNDFVDTDCFWSDWCDYLSNAYHYQSICKGDFKDTDCFWNDSCASSINHY